MSVQAMRGVSLPPGARIVPARRVRRLPKSAPAVVRWDEDRYQARIIAARAAEASP